MLYFFFRLFYFMNASHKQLDKIEKWATRCLSMCLVLPIRIDDWNNTQFAASEHHTNNGVAKRHLIDREFGCFRRISRPRCRRTRCAHICRLLPIVWLPSVGRRHRAHGIPDRRTGRRWWFRIACTPCRSSHYRWPTYKLNSPIRPVCSNRFPRCFVSYRLAQRVRFVQDVPIQADVRHLGDDDLSLCWWTNPYFHRSHWEWLDLCACDISI